MTDSDPQVPQQTPVVDTAKLVQEAAEKAAHIATEQATAKARQEFIDRMTGTAEIPDDAPLWRKQGKEEPSTWDEVDRNTTQKAERIAAKIVKEELDKVETARKTQAEAAAKATAEYQSNWQKAWNEQVESLEKSGELEPVPDPIKEKIAKGLTLTPEEQKNEALVKQWDLRKAAYAENPYTNIETYYYKQKAQGTRAQQSSTDAPVFGVSKSGAVNNKKDDFSYEEIQNARLKKDPMSLLQK